MEMSNHSEIRCQQRGISQEQVDLIISHGQKWKRPGGAWEYRLRRKDKDRIISALKSQIHMVERSVGKRVLISGDHEKVVTTYHLLSR